MLIQMSNLDGELIGINNAIATDGWSRTNAGVGFAHSLLDSLCRNPRELNQLTKSIISQGLELSLAQGLDLEAKRCIEYIIETGQG